MIDNTERAQIGWGLWLGWVLASIEDFAVGRDASWVAALDAWN